jgi:tRNA-specific 2-thiouridylase
VADTLGIPHYVLDYESRFKQDVIERFADSYLAGETPVPCIECNKKIKFRDLLSTARELGAAALATGHYVASRALPGGGRGLYRAADPDKDQSYFLYGTTADQLDVLRFPLGEMPKSETRAIAHELGLSVADKSDSQDLCFVPSGKYTDIIERLRPEAVNPGEIVHLDGRVLGQHQGIIHYTIGQRRGLGVESGEPLYVVKLDAAAARVIVGPREALETRIVHLREINWLGDQPLSEMDGLPIAVRVRSTRQPQAAILQVQDGSVMVQLPEGEFGVSPGQACVFYESTDIRSRVLGGGSIVSPKAQAFVPKTAADHGFGLSV